MARTFLTRLGLSSIILVSAPLTALACASQVELGGTVDGGANTHVGGSGNVGGGGAVGGGGSLGGASAFPGAGGNLTAGMGPGTGGATSSFQRQVNNAVTGIDLLLMIDNSSSMADKQATLADAMPQFRSVGSAKLRGCQPQFAQSTRSSHVGRRVSVSSRFHAGVQSGQQHSYRHRDVQPW